MAATPELQPGALENDASRRESLASPPAQESMAEHSGGLPGRVFSGAAGEPSAEGAARLLGNPTFSHSANSSPRAISLKRAQQTHGNRFAQQVVSGIQRKPAASQIVQRECACGGRCEKCREDGLRLSLGESPAPDSSPRLIQGKAANANGISPSESGKKEVIPSDSPGHPLDQQTRGVMESGFGRDFSDVLIHTDSHAATSAKALGANAYTSGRDIYFAAGKYAPENDDGKRLLAHELVHTIQQRGNTPSFARQSASISNLIIDPDDSLEHQADRAAQEYVSGAHPLELSDGEERKRRESAPGQRVVQRAPDDAPKVLGVATPAEPTKGDLPPGALSLEVGYWTFTTDQTQLQAELLKVVAERGLHGLEDALWYTRMSHNQDLCNQVEGQSPECRDWVTAKYKVIQALELAIPVVRKSHEDFLGSFEKQLQANTLSTLQANEEQTKTEMVRYGIAWRDEPPEIKYSLIGALVGGIGGGISISVATHYSMSESAPSSRGLQEAAKIALSRRLQIEERRKTQSNEVKWVRVSNMGEHSTESWPTARYYEIANQVAEMEKQYEQLLRTLAEPYPVLAYFGALNKSLSTLTAMAQLGPSEGMASIVGPRIREQLGNIEKVRNGIKEGEVNFWLLPKIVEMTKAQLGVDHDPLRKRLVDDKVEDEQPGPLQSIALAVLDIVALLLAPATGGLSLVVAAGINTAVAVKNVQDYLLQKAMANTAFNRAEAISQEEPSLFWVAVDIVAIIPDLGDALRAFRGLSSAIRSARRARLGVEASAEADNVIRAVARQHKLTDEVAESIVRGARDPDFALRKLGVAESELDGLRTARKQVEQEAEAAEVVAANAAAGGTVKVSPGGLIFSCTSPCTVLREHYAQQLAHAPQEVLDELNRLEAAAATARGNTQAMQPVADQAAALEARIRNVPVATWRSPAAESANFNDLVRRRGSAAPELDRHPPEWTGAEEAHFRYGASAKPDEGYRWVLTSDGTLRYERMSRELPVKRFDPDTGTFHVVPERQAAIQLESAEELGRLAEAGKAATNRSKWLSALRRIPGLDHLSDKALGRVLKLSPNIDHMKGQLLEELVGPTLKTEARRLTREQPHYFEFISGDHIRDAAGRQLTDGMILRRRRDGIYEVVAYGEAKAGAASSQGLRTSRKSYSELTEDELQELQREAISEIRVRAGYDIDYVGPMPGLSTDELLRTRSDEIKAIMRDLHGEDMGQIRKDFERLMPGADETTVTILIDGKPTRVRASSKTTRAIGITPSDVSIQQTIQNLIDQGIKLEAHEIGITAQELEALARQLRAEALTNGPRFAPPL